MNRTPCYVFDIDGTLADCSHRLHLIHKDPPEWDAFHAACTDDKPIAHMIGLANALLYTGYDLVFVTGRPDDTREATESWLSTQLCTPEYVYMRKAGDHRDDVAVKTELIAQLRADGFEPIMVFEDRKRVVDMWREAGIPCMQVAPGNY